MTQKELIEQYMEDFGSITPMEAFSDLGITKLATRISEMIDEGATFIEKQIVYSKNRYGRPCHYMKYIYRRAEDGSNSSK